MTDPDHRERARQALWLARKTLDETPAGGTIAPGLRDVYLYADRAHSALTATDDPVAALEEARRARLALHAAAIDVAGLERWLGTDAGGETAESFLRQIHEDVDAAIEALAIDGDAEEDGTAASGAEPVRDVTLLHWLDPSLAACRDLVDVHDVVLAGLPAATLDRLVHRHGLGEAELATVLRVSRRTLGRRRARGHLSVDESDRLCRAAAVLEAVQPDWLRTSRDELGDRRPLDLLGTGVGRRAVSELLSAQIR